MDFHNLGAFDIVWFNEAYKTLGKERFDKLYDGRNIFQMEVNMAELENMLMQ